MHEVAVGERAADVHEVAQDLLIGHGGPAGQRDLEIAEAEVIGDLEALDDVPGREADHADHGHGRTAEELVTKDLYDAPEAGGIDGVPLAGGPEDVDPPEPIFECEAKLTSKHVLHQPLLLIPWANGGDHDGRGIAGHGGRFHIER